MPKVECSLEIMAEPDKVWPVICDMTAYPEFMPDVKSVTVIERKENSTVTEWRTTVDGRPINWSERDYFYPDRLRIEYEQIAGDLKKFTGFWQLTPAEGGTVVVLSVDFEFGIPMVAGLLNPLLKKKVRDNSMAMLTAIKNRLEKNPQ
ncbi:MAG: aromatase/cyclase [Negativicutes bacterium]|nr:aromatase/cyclase [Negativicutes bacterium]